jgi:hypothetical protein
MPKIWYSFPSAKIMKCIISTCNYGVVEKDYLVEHPQKSNNLLIEFLAKETGTKT